MLSGRDPSILAEFSRHTLRRVMAAETESTLNCGATYAGGLLKVSVTTTGGDVIEVNCTEIVLGFSSL